ncbi:hypothetical protein D3C74_389820 [compost metagenome]
MACFTVRASLAWLASFTALLPVVEVLELPVFPFELLPQAEIKTASINKIMEVIHSGFVFLVFNKSIGPFTLNENNSQNLNCLKL